MGNKFIKFSDKLEIAKRMEYEEFINEIKEADDFDSRNIYRLRNLEANEAYIEFKRDKAILCTAFWVKLFVVMNIVLIVIQLLAIGFSPNSFISHSF